MDPESKADSSPRLPRSRPPILKNSSCSRMVVISSVLQLKDHKDCCFVRPNLHHYFCELRVLHLAVPELFSNHLLLKVLSWLCHGGARSEDFAMFRKYATANVTAWYNSPRIREAKNGDVHLVGFNKTISWGITILSIKHNKTAVVSNSVLRKEILLLVPTHGQKILASPISEQDQTQTRVMSWGFIVTLLISNSKNHCLFLCALWNITLTDDVWTLGTLGSVHVRHVRDHFASNPPHSSSSSTELKRANRLCLWIGERWPRVGQWCSFPFSWEACQFGPLEKVSRLLLFRHNNVNAPCCENSHHSRMTIGLP